MAQFKKGQGGRRKGAVNKVNRDMRAFIENLLADNEDQLREDWAKLKPAQRIVMWDRLLRYMLPTLSSTTLEGLEKSKVKETKQVFIIGGQTVEF